jgi:hypothetical protein
MSDLGNLDELVAVLHGVRDWLVDLDAKLEGEQLWQAFLAEHPELEDGGHAG